MTSKPIPTPAKSAAARPARKNRKGATETSRLFIDVEEIIRHPQTTPLTRYVE
jgi:hypothetical protein